MLLIDFYDRLDGDSFFRVFKSFVKLAKLIYFDQFIEWEHAALIIIHQLGNEHLWNRVTLDYVHYRFAFCHDSAQPNRTTAVDGDVEIKKSSSYSVMNRTANWSAPFKVSTIQGSVQYSIFISFNLVCGRKLKKPASIPLLHPTPSQ